HHQVSRALELSGDPKVNARDHGENERNWDTPLASGGGASRFEKLRARAAAGSRQTRAKGRAVLVIGIFAENSGFGHSARKTAAAFRARLADGMGIDAATSIPGDRGPL